LTTQRHRTDSLSAAVGTDSQARTECPIYNPRVIEANVCGSRFRSLESLPCQLDDPLIYNPYLNGQLEMDRKHGTFTRFAVLARGDLTGSSSGGNQLGRRIGTHPLAVAFQLVDPNETPAMRLHPRGHPGTYWTPRKPRD
jgi:hypothetical protein